MRRGPSLASLLPSIADSAAQVPQRCRGAQARRTSHSRKGWRQSRNALLLVGLAISQQLQTLNVQSASVVGCPGQAWRIFLRIAIGS